MTSAGTIQAFRAILKQEGGGFMTGQATPPNIPTPETNG